MCTGGFRKPYIDQAVGGVWGVKDVIGRTEERAAIQSVASTWLKKIRVGKVLKGHLVRRRGDERSCSDQVIGKGGHCTCTLKVATAVLENLQHSALLIPESLSYTVNFSRKKLRTIIPNDMF
jgi:hypothetical protein